MKSAIEFLKARFGERSTQLQIAVLVLVGLVVAGVISLEQIDNLTEKALLMLTALGPLVGIFSPDKPSQQQIVEAAVAVAEQTPAYAKVQEKVEEIEEAAQPILDALKKL